MTKRKRHKIIILFILIALLSSLFLGSGMVYADDAGFISRNVPVDLILVIDESGSMRTNDPNDLRVDAAKLFIELNQILTEGNRVSVVGFGEVTNIYIEPTGVAMNKQGIIEAVSSIKSNQQYTDMKGALEEVKLMLDERAKKNNAVVIFLTDGDLGIDDIPIPDEIRNDESGDRVKPEPPSRGTDEGGTSSGNSKEDIGSDISGTNREDRLNEYLEDYKEELFNLCYEYLDDGIKIFPIAFTAEANTDILKEISSITGSRMWVSQTAADIRNVYLDIFKYITSTFISVIPQEGTAPLKGEIELTDYIRKAAFIAVANGYSESPSIALSVPPGSPESEFTNIDDSSYSIRVIEAPEEGKWEYDVDGDLVLALDLADIELIDPLKAVYFMDSSIPIVLQLLHPGIEEETIAYSDFIVTCNIEFPQGKKTGSLELLDDGIGMDEKDGDGIFSYGFEGVESPGEYIIEFTIEHLPTGTSALKKKIFTVTDYQPVKKELYLKIGNNIITGTPVTIYANLDDFSEGDFTYKVTDPYGDMVSGELLDNGTADTSDKEKGDGIYSSIVEGFSGPGIYNIEVSVSYESNEGYELTQVSTTEIGKYVDIELISGDLEADTGSMTVEAKLKITSIYDSDILLGIERPAADGGFIKNIELDTDMVQAGSEKEVNVTIHLSDLVQERGNTVIIPFLINGVYKKDVEIVFSAQKGIFEFDLKTLIGLIIIFLSLIPLIFFLYTIINIKSIGIRITHPRIIVEFSIFIVLFVAGLIVIFV